MNNYSN